ncbi:class I SAM-dependent methyltransferase [Nocardia sp. BMG111209]|uniref:class I SAM-dependent methyltransferase n=1 Tax=Nocardia sp. BMG111209 TaxID=1160137 RepID=UPI00038086A0|nr:class I SAM-dependent methyltransferase [Nocardia sp. BMG111209]
MLDYDREAATYDATRGGEERADAAAAAITTLLPPRAAVLVDVACGTGIVGARLRGPGRRVLGVDRSAGMLAHARPRLDAALRGDAGRLPLADATVDAVTVVWLLHLIPAVLVTAALTEAARVLRPGGVLITTVNKTAADHIAPSDVADIIGPAYAAHAGIPTDDAAGVTTVAGHAGLYPAAGTRYTGHGQGRSPADWAAALPHFRWTDPALVTRLRDRLAALPAQDRPRPDPIYTVVSFRKSAPATGHSAREFGSGPRGSDPAG